MSNKEKLFAAIYGQPKFGKTRAAIAGLPSSLFLYTFDGMATAKWLGLDIKGKAKAIPTKPDRSPLDELVANVEKYGSKVPSIVIDDFTFMCSREISWLKKHRVTGFAVYMTLAEKAMDLMVAIDEAPCHCAITLHEIPAKEKMISEEEKVTVVLPGGPAIPGDLFRSSFPGIPSFVTRIVDDEDFPGPWKKVFVVNPEDPLYPTGNRILDISSTRLPPNLGEIMRISGYDVPRPKELEWMEEATEQLSAELLPLLETEDYSETLNKFHVNYKEKDPRHVRWAIMDSFDRANLKSIQADLVTGYIEAFE